MAHFQNQVPPTGQQTQPVLNRPSQFGSSAGSPTGQLNVHQRPATDQLANDMNNLNLSSQKSGRSRRFYAPVEQPPQINHSNSHKPLGLESREIRKPRIDPNTIPSPVATRMQDAERCERPEYNFYTCLDETMPTSMVDFKCIDQGNSNPRFIRSTMREIPDDSNFVRDTGLAFGLVIQPLAPLHKEDQQVPLVLEEPVRCHRCKGYINPWCRYTDVGKKYVCNLCDFENTVPESQFRPVDSYTGRRIDTENCPELMYGSVDFQVSEEYWLGVEPCPLHYMFALDVSSSATSMLKHFCGAIWDLVNLGSFPLGAKIGIMTFDSTLHFYNLQSTQDSATMMVVSDIDDVFVPMSKGLFVDPKESRTVICKLLEQIPTMFQASNTPSAVFGSAVKAIQLAMKDCGGKVILTQTTLPSIGLGILKNRDDPNLYACEREKSLFLPQTDYYTQLGNAFVQAGVSIDLWLLPQAKNYIDVATLGVLSALTGGDTHYFSHFDESQHKQIYYNLKHSVQREHGYRSTSRLRCSNGISVANYYGNFFMNNATDLELAGVNRDTTIGVELKYDGNKIGNTVYFQYAMLYTTSVGERRLRVHNLRLGVAKTVSALFKGADLDASLGLLTKRFITQSSKKSLCDISNELDQLCVQILLGYRKFVTPQAAPAQLVLPETIKTLPLLLSSFKKSLVLRKDASVNPDIRVDVMRRFKTASVQEITRRLYPQMVKVHEWVVQQDKTRLPLERLSYDRLDSSGIYWIDAHDDIYLWLGKEASPQILKSIIGSLNLESTNGQINGLVEIEGSPLWTLYNNVGSLPKFHLIRQGLNLEIELSSVLIEDEVCFQMSYPDYLCEIHKQIKQELEREIQQTAISAASYWAYRY